jgi:hypothetical protein
MMAWEREVYVGMLANHIQQENQKMKSRQAARRR